MTEKAHCPGFEQNKTLKTIVCKCPACGQEIEVFSDELDRFKKCSACGREIDPSQCRIDGKA